METINNTCACKGKNLDKMLQPAILTILYRETSHGFKIIEQIGESPMFNGSDPDKAGVYRYLKKMEADGLLSSEWMLDEDNSKPKRMYSITEQGRVCLTSWLNTLIKYNDDLGRMINSIEETIDN